MAVKIARRRMRSSLFAAGAGAGAAAAHGLDGAAFGLIDHVVLLAGVDGLVLRPLDLQHAERALVERAEDRMVDQDVRPGHLHIELHHVAPPAGISVVCTLCLASSPPSGYTRSKISPMTWNDETRFGPALPRTGGRSRPLCA